MRNSEVGDSEKVINGILYRQIPGYPYYLAGEDGSLWKGQLDRDPSEWFAPNRQYHKNARTVYVMVHTKKVGQDKVRWGELILRAFDRAPNRMSEHIGYRDGNAENLRPDNLYWADKVPSPRKKISPKKKPIGRGAFVGKGVKVIPLTWGNETQVERNHASQDHRTANPPHHLPDR